MGLPAESLEFLTRGTKFSKPPVTATLRNLPGLWRLLLREWKLEKDFAKDYELDFDFILNQLENVAADNLSPAELLSRIDNILLSLTKATYYSIFAPLSLALRQKILKVSLEDLDNSKTPEIAAVNSLQKIALETRSFLPINSLEFNSCASLFAYLAEVSDGDSILERLDKWLNDYGYLSEVATDISIPRWQEDKSPIRQMFTQFIFQNNQVQPAQKAQESKQPPNPSFSVKQVQKRLNLKGKVTEIYSKLLAHLRYSFLALEKQWLQLNLLTDAGDIFFLKLDEIRDFIENTPQATHLTNLIQQRKLLWQECQNIDRVPYLIYGNPPIANLLLTDEPLSTNFRLTGIGASAGIVEGKVKVLRSITEAVTIDRKTILVLPYTDSGWSPILAQAGGLIAEVGGTLSHGAIIAREFGIPAVMDIHDATQVLRDDQLVRIDGQKGIVEILS
jgi:pyruvate,water dikinase